MKPYTWWEKKMIFGWSYEKQLLKDIGIALLLAPVYLGIIWLLVYDWIKALS